MAKGRPREPELRDTEDFPRWKYPIVKNEAGGDNVTDPDREIQSGMLYRTARETGHYVRVGGEKPRGFK